MKFKADGLNILVILLEVLQGNLGLGVEVVPVKQVLVYLGVILLVVNLGMGRMGKKESQQVLDSHLVGVFLVEVFRVEEDFLVVEDSLMAVARVDFWVAVLEVFRVVGMEVVDPLVMVAFLEDPLVEVVDQVAMLVVFMEDIYRRGWVA